MKLRKAIALCAALICALAFSAQAYAASGDLVYEFTKAEKDKLVASGEATDTLIKAGDVVFSADGSGVKLSNRSADYHTVDIKAGVLKKGVEYTVLVTVRGLTKDIGIEPMVGGGSYTRILTQTSVTVPAGKTDTIKIKVYDGGDYEKYPLRIASTNDTASVDFVIENILIYEGDPPAGGSGGGGGAANPATGSSPVVYYALTVAVLGFVLSAVFSRKARAK